MKMSLHSTSKVERSSSIGRLDEEAVQMIKSRSRSRSFSQPGVPVAMNRLAPISSASAFLASDREKTVISAPRATPNRTA